MDTAPQVNQSSRPSVSILMLTYNRASFIKAAVESALAQTYRDFELIIIDDGSNDNTADIIARFNDARIQYIRHKERRGLLARRKESLIRAKGDYVAVLDSDDRWQPQKLEKQLAYLAAHPTCVLVGTWINTIDSDGEVQGETRYHTDDTSIRNSMLWRNQFAHSSVIIRTQALAKTEGYRFPLDEDLDLFLQLGMHGAFGNIPEPLTHYRIHDGGQSRNRRGMVQNVLRIITTHRHAYPGYLPAYIKYFLSYLATFIRTT